MGICSRRRQCVFLLSVPRSPAAPQVPGRATAANGIRQTKLTWRARTPDAAGSGTRGDAGCARHPPSIPAGGAGDYRQRLCQRRHRDDRGCAGHKRRRGIGNPHQLHRAGQAKTCGRTPIVVTNGRPDPLGCQPVFLQERRVRAGASAEPAKLHPHRGHVVASEFSNDSNPDLVVVNLGAAGAASTVSLSWPGYRRIRQPKHRAGRHPAARPHRGGCGRQQSCRRDRGKLRQQQLHRPSKLRQRNADGQGSTSTGSVGADAVAVGTSTATTSWMSRWPAPVPSRQAAR